MFDGFIIEIKNLDRESRAVLEITLKFFQPISYCQMLWTSTQNNNQKFIIYLTIIHITFVPMHCKQIDFFTTPHLFINCPICTNWPFITNIWDIYFLNQFFETCLSILNMFQLCFLNILHSLFQLFFTLVILKFSSMVVLLSLSHLRSFPFTFILFIFFLITVFFECLCRCV